MPEEERDFARRYLGASDSDVPERSLRAVMSSAADRVITPLQDVLERGGESRMNVPGEAEGNWTWRCTESDLHDDRLDHLADLTWLYGRARDA
jgi:4-alpha-glucanotransferase